MAGTGSREGQGTRGRHRKFYFYPICPIQGFLPHQLPPDFLPQRCRRFCPHPEAWWQ